MAARFSRPPGGVESVMTSNPNPSFRLKLNVDRAHAELTVADLRDILAGSGRVFERGVPVRIVIDKAVGGSIAHVLTADSLALETHFACQPRGLVKVGGQWVERDIPLPLSIARMYLGWKGEWGLPLFNGIATAPLLSEDGSIRTARGYDEETGLWCEEMPDVAGLVPARPTYAEAKAAFRTVRSAFKTFCFADAVTVTNGATPVVDLRRPPGVDESSFLCTLLGSVCRACLWLAPGALFRGAPHSGSGAGKGKLARCICAVAYGRQPSAVPPGGSYEEIEKRVSSSFLEGSPAVLLDNFNNFTLRSASLESVLTERPAKVRQFRTLDLVTLNALASVFVTGNGVLLARDLVRRFIPTEFDAGTEDPEQRAFEGDILADMMRRRSELLVALLTIWRWGRQNRLERGIVLGSYEQWCAWARDPLIALGCADPVARVIETKQRDPQRQATHDLFVVWWGHHRDAPTKAYELHLEGQKIIDPQGRGRQFVAAQLEKLVGTRLGGYVLTRQRGDALYAVATYALLETSKHHFTQPPDEGDDPHASDERAYLDTENQYFTQQPDEIDDPLSPDERAYLDTSTAPSGTPSPASRQGNAHRKHAGHPSDEADEASSRFINDGEEDQ
jgi:hypothetical protein